MNSTDRLRFALPRCDDLPQLEKQLGDCGFRLPTETESFEVHRFEDPFEDDLDFEIFTLSPDDIGTYVQRGIVQLGVLSTDVLYEREVDVWRPFTFNFGSYPVILGARRGQSLNSLTSRPTVRLATPIPRYTREWFTQRGFEVEVIPVSENVQEAVALGLADGFVDRLTDPQKLVSAGFRALERLGTTHLKLVANNASSARRRSTIGRLIERLEATRPESQQPIAIPFDNEDAIR